MFSKKKLPANPMLLTIAGIFYFVWSDYKFFSMSSAMLSGLA